MTTITAGHGSRELLAPARARQLRRSTHDRPSSGGRFAGLRVAVRMLAVTLIVICALALDNHAITMPDVSVANLGTNATALLDSARRAVADGATTASDGAVSDATTDAAALDDAGPSPHELARCWRQAHRLGLDPADCASANG